MDTKKKLAVMYAITLSINKVYDDGSKDSVANKTVEFTKRDIKRYTKAVRNTKQAKDTFKGMIDESTLDNKYLLVNCKDMFKTNIFKKELISKDKGNDKRAIGANLTLYFGDKVEFETIVKDQPKQLPEKIDESESDVI